MNNEEIQKALEIIKQPITVNCEDYHYFDQENYDKLVAVFNNCQWFITNVEQIIDNCNELKSKIDKVIKLLESQEQDMMGNFFFDDNVAERILVILEGGYDE